MDENKNKNLQWKKTCTQLKQAFEAWDELRRNNPEISADEKRLKEMQILLRDLKGKIEALSSPDHSRKK